MTDLDTQRFLDPYDDTAAIFDGSGGVIDIGKVLHKTREVMERMQFDTTVDVSFLDVAELDVMAGMVESGFGTMWFNNIAEISSDILIANYGSVAILPAPHDIPWFADQFDIPEHVWEWGHNVLDFHAAGVNKDEIYSDGIDTLDDIAMTLLATFLLYGYRLELIDRFSGGQV